MKIKKLKRCNLSEIISSTVTTLPSFEVKRWIDRFGTYYDPPENVLEDVLALERGWLKFLEKNDFIKVIT